MIFDQYPTPILVRMDNHLSHQEDTAYADDLFSISARREGLQLKANVPLEKWLGGDGNTTFFDHYEIDGDDPQELRDKFLSFPSHMPIPTAIREIIWEALTVPQYNNAIAELKLKAATTRTVTLEDLQAAIARSPKTSVAGPSRLSYTMMKTWILSSVIEAHQAMTMIWETGQISNWWKKK